jgi:hypothetical protein
MRTAEILRKSAEVIRERGLCKGKAEAYDGSVCALGAIAVATGGVPEELAYGPNGVNIGFDSGAGALANYLATIDGWSSERPPHIPTWSDHRSTTQDDVANTMEKAAAWIEEQA